MGEIVGRLTCPVCGEPMQDLKINKNYKLYCYCDNGCKSQINSKYSRSTLATLRAGRSVVLEKIGVIRPVTDNSKDELEEELDI